jgi:hypothetical protein
MTGIFARWAIGDTPVLARKGAAHRQHGTPIFVSVNDS